MLLNCVWCWRRLLRVPWTARRSNQSTLKEISPEYSLEGLILKLKLQYSGPLMWSADSFEKTLILRKIGFDKVVIQLLSRVQLFATPWTAARQASLSFTVSRSLLKLMCVESVKMKVAQLCPTLCDPMDYVVHGILQARIMECVACLFSRGSSWPRSQTWVSCIAGR